MIACLQLWYLFYKIGIKEAGENEREQAAWTKFQYRTANLAPHSANTETVFKTIHQIMTSSFSYRDPETGFMTTNQCLIEWFYLKDKTINTPPYKQFFDGNCYIEHRSLGADQGGAIADKPFGLITYDEGGRSNHLELEVRGVILARLFDWNGKLHIISTPDSNSNSSLYYYQIFKDGLIGINDTFTMTGSLKDNTFFSPEQIREQYDLYKNDPLRDQVLEGKFVFGGDTVFDTQSILEAQDESLDDGLRREEGHNYIIGIDTAIGSDEFSMSCIDVTKKPYRLVREIACKGNSKSPQMHLNDLLDLLDIFYESSERNVAIILETWNGESARFYMDLPAWVQAITETYGAWSPEKIKTDNKNPNPSKPNNVKKADIIVALKKILSARELKIPKNDTVLTDELSIYREEDSRLKTDRVMSLALAVNYAESSQSGEEIEWQAIEW